VPVTEVVYFQDEEGRVPLLGWFESLPSKALLKCHARLERLELLGHELRRPEADYLRDEIYELRASTRGFITGCSTSFMDARLLWCPTDWRRKERFPRKRLTSL
jgi:hypothetical protein